MNTSKLHAAWAVHKNVGLDQALNSAWLMVSSWRSVLCNAMLTTLCFCRYLITHHVVDTLGLKSTTSIQSLLSLYMTYDSSIDLHRKENKACVFQGTMVIKICSLLFYRFFDCVWAASFFPYTHPDMLAKHCFGFSSAIINWRSWQSTVLFLIKAITWRQAGGHILEVQRFFCLLPKWLNMIFSHCGWDFLPRPQPVSKYLCMSITIFIFHQLIIHHKMRKHWLCSFLLFFLGRTIPWSYSLFASDQFLEENSYHEL